MKTSKWHISLTKGDTPQDAVACAAHEDEIIYFRSLIDDENAFEGYEVLFWLGTDLFDWLEEGYQLAEMSLEHHCYVWQGLESDRDDYETQDGIQLYLDYCKHNGITQELLARETGYDGMDIMTFYGGKDEEGEQTNRLGEIFGPSYLKSQKERHPCGAFPFGFFVRMPV